MRKALILLLALCALATGFVPREKRAVDKAQPGISSSSSSTTSAKPSEICAPSTPCAWSIYKPVIKVVDLVVASSYCVCGPGTNCVVNEDDKSVNAYVHRCRPPNSTDEILSR